MPSWKTRYRRPLYRKIAAWRDKIAEISPPWLRKSVGPVVDYLDMIFIDHGIFRVVYANRFKLTDEVWRASQPWPHQIRGYAKKGVRTIVNLRGERDCGSYRLEQKACAKYGVKLVNFKLRSRAAPDKESLNAFQPFFDNLDYPILIHCKSGADRVGLACTLYMLLNEKAPLEQATGQLDFRYGHFKQASTGILDYFFERYGEENSENQTPFLEWVERDYDPDELKRSFKIRSSWSNWMVDKVLRRE